ncbi:hypothetical protein BP5796_01936 [Coleophoma crateriformis]|uniref:PNPLA domain-containing protein n=1 Tax=Coleophoma crateriformis TaxID=565419 RepID=A0A3D8T1U8_9HELO|nr:hypothetical protein BP5796_01936 [Coleophoma crateriformis]
MSTKHSSAEPDPLDVTGLCLLSLDGGGVRGLSTLFILKGIMDRLNHERKILHQEQQMTADFEALKPCDVFDLIGGTSTGGLIAIMLGRLEMDVDQCITAYSDLAAVVFGEKLNRMPFNIQAQVQPRFDSAKLKTTVQKVIAESKVAQNDASETELLNDKIERGCKTFVCTVDRDTKNITRLRSYSLPEERNIPATIWQAALATSAATTFFEPVTIGHRTFTDGGLGANNPVDEVEDEASNIWCKETADLKPLVKCFISIGTGNPGKDAFKDNILNFLGQTVVAIATETENTEKKFIARWRKHFDEQRYFRFNVEQGLQDIGLDEHGKIGKIEAATEEYLAHTAQKFRVRDCIRNLSLKQSRAQTNLLSIINEFNERRIVDLHNVSRNESLWIVPFQQNPQFVGRSSELDKANAMLSSKTRCERVAFYGLGGVGKTQIALEFIYQVRVREPDCSVFWIPVTDIESMLEAYLEIAKQLQIPNIEKTEADVLQLVQQRLNQEDSGKWLLVFDNADDINIWTDKANDGTGRRISYLPKSKHGSIIFTTRSREAAVKLAGKNVVPIYEMNDAMAKDLLEKHLIDSDLLTDGKATKDVLQKLTYLPLAIVQAVAYININRITLLEYAKLLDDTEQNIVDILSTEFEDEGRYDNINNPVATTWLVSFEQIQTRNPLAAEYLSFMSCVNANDIPESLLPPGLSRKNEIDAIGILDAYSFISKRSADKAIDMHQLVHLVTRNWLQEQNLLAQWTERTVSRLNDILQESSDQNRSVWRRYLVHAYYTLESDLVSKDWGERINLVRKVGMCLGREGRFNEAGVLMAEVMEIDKKVLGNENPQTLTSMNDLAYLFFRQGKYDEAEPIYRQTLQLRAKVLGDEHPDTLGSRHNLALLLKSQGKYDEAEPIYRQTLQLSAKVLGEEHPDTLTSRNNLALLFYYQGKYDEAEPIYRQTLQLSAKVLGDEHPDTLGSRNNLAGLLESQGKYDEAEPIYRQTLQLRAKVLGEEHPDTLQSRNNLAGLFHRQGKYDEAEPI